MSSDALICPHCQQQHLSTGDLPKEVVVVVPCPGCGELAVMFREMVVPVDRSLLRSGTRRKRILHIAEIISEFVDSGVIPEANSILLGEHLPFLAAEDASGARPLPNPITDEEFVQFQKVDLRAIDNAASFRQIFG